MNCSTPRSRLELGIVLDSIVLRLGSFVVAFAAVFLGANGARGDKGAPARLYFQDRGYLSVVAVDAPGKVRRLVRLPKSEEASGIAAAGHYLFWTAGTRRGGVFRSNRDGTRQRELVSKIRFASSVVAVGRFVYWLAEDSIGRVDTSGGHVSRQFVIPSQEGGGRVGDGLATDGRYLYVSRCSKDSSIARVRLDGRGLVEGYIRIGNSCPQDLAYANGYLYWTQLGLATAGFIGRASTKGSRVDPHWLDVGSHAPYAVAADSSDLFWVWGGGGGAPTYIGHATATGRIANLRFVRGDSPVYVAP